MIAIDKRIRIEHELLACSHLRFAMTVDKEFKPIDAHAGLRTNLRQQLEFAFELITLRLSLIPI